MRRGRIVWEEEGVYVLSGAHFNFGLYIFFYFFLLFIY